MMLTQPHMEAPTSFERPARGSDNPAAEWLRRNKEKKAQIDAELQRGVEAARAARQEQQQKAPPTESRLQKTFQDFRHGVLHFEGVGLSARFLLPPPHLEDASQILRAMFERTFWNLDPPAVVFQADDLYYAGGGVGGGYFLQDDGGQARPVQWEGTWRDWKKVVGDRARDEEMNAVAPQMHMQRMQTVARACHHAAVEHDLFPWFFSGAPCLGGGDGGKAFADYSERSGNSGARPIFVGAPSPAQGLFDEDREAGAAAPSPQEPLENMGTTTATTLSSGSQPQPQPSGSRKQPSSTSEGSSSVLPFFLRAMPDVDLQAFAVKMNEAPSRRASYPDERRNLLGDKDSNRRFLNPGVTHYIFFRRQQEGLYRSFKSMLESALAASIRIVVGPSLNPSYAKAIWDDARRRRGSMTLILDKSAPLATRMAAGLRAKREGKSSMMEDIASGFHGMSGSYDLSPVEVPREVDSQTLASCEIVPFLEDATDEGFYHRLSDLLCRKLPRLASVQNRASDSAGAMMLATMERVDHYWELASRLHKTADKRHHRRKLLQHVAVWAMLIAYLYAIFFGYDVPEGRGAPVRPCEADMSPVHWLGSIWKRVCPYQNWIRYIHAFVPAISVAMLMKLSMPITLAYDEHGRWLRSASADVIREIYRYRTHVGPYRPIPHRWSKSTATPHHMQDSSYVPRAPPIIFEERSEKIQGHVLTNTGIEVDHLAKPSKREIEDFRKASLSKPSGMTSAEPGPPGNGSSYARVGDGDQPVTSPRIETIDDGKSLLHGEEYVAVRLIGTRERFEEKRARQLLRYQCWWAMIIFFTIAASIYSVMRWNLSMLMSMVVLTSLMVFVDMDHMPLRLKHTGTAIQVLGEYLAAWEKLTPRERKTHAKLHSLVDGVEDIILKEDPHYMSDFMAIHTGSVATKAAPEPNLANPHDTAGRSLHYSPRRPDLTRIEITGGTPSNSLALLPPEPQMPQGARLTAQMTLGRLAARE
jgi:hypothetical protein